MIFTFRQYSTYPLEDGMKHRFFNFLILMIAITLILIFTGSLNAIPQHNADKTADKLAKTEAKLEKILGTNTSWKPRVFESLRLDMPCAQVKEIFRGIKCQDSKKYSFPKVSGKLMGTVKEYQFTFKYGKLQSATIIFGARVFDAQRFETALINVAQRKWGTLAQEKLAKKNKFWYNTDRDSVSLTYFNTTWHLKVSMPRRDTGKITAGTLNEAELKLALANLIGTNKTWVVPSMAKFKRGMYCGQVLQVYKTMKGCDPAKSWSWGTITIKDHPLVHALKLSFNKGQLTSATLIFHRQINCELFKKVSLELFEGKWGKLKPEKRDKDTITIYKSKFGIAQRSFMVDHWEIKHDFPKM